MARSESRKVAGDKYPSWLTPFDAVQLLLKAGLDDREHAVNWLAARLKTGELAAIAIGVELTENDDLSDEYYYFVSSRVWRNVNRIPWKHDFWISGTFTEDPDTFVERIMQYGDVIFQVRFDPDVIQTFVTRTLSLSANVGAVASPAKQKGGRPAKPIWDQLWAHIAAQLYVGDLKPKRQADIENAMNDWLTSNGHDAGESTVRRMARTLWQVIATEDQN